MVEMDFGQYQLIVDADVNQEPESEKRLAFTTWQGWKKHTSPTSGNPSWSSQAFDWTSYKSCGWIWNMLRHRERAECSSDLLKGLFLEPLQRLLSPLATGQHEGKSLRGDIRLFTIWLSWALCTQTHITLNTWQHKARKQSIQLQFNSFV